MEHLDERKTKILKAIIKTYLETGEPVGSRTISKYTDLNLSSATIRNEMAFLEKKGLIKKTHSSSGRLPSTNGYRFYINHLMDPLPANDADQAIIKKALDGKFEEMDEIVKQSADILSNLTHYTALALRPEQRKHRSTGERYPEPAQACFQHQERIQASVCCSNQRIPDRYQGRA